MEENKNKIKEYNRQYYLNHREEMLDYGKKKVVCKFCNKTVSRNNLLKHQNTKKCLILSDKFKIE